MTTGTLAEQSEQFITNVYWAYLSQIENKMLSEKVQISFHNPSSTNPFNPAEWHQHFPEKIENCIPNA